MSERILHCAGIVLVSWAVIYMLRALPFIVFSRSARSEKPWLRTVERWLSPTVIALLVAYSYSGLEWRTLWPYISGLIVVLMQLRFGNGLVSILVGTVAYMVLIRI